MVVTAGSLMDMIEFTKALTLYESVSDNPLTGPSVIENATRHDRSRESCACVCHPAVGVLKAAKKKLEPDTARTTPGTERETLIVIGSGDRSPDEKPGRVAANRTEPQRDLLALYPNHRLSKKSLLGDELLSERHLRNQIVIGSFVKMGSKLLPASAPRASTTAGVTIDGEYTSPTIAEEAKVLEENLGFHSTGKSSLFSRLSNNVRRSK